MIAHVLSAQYLIFQIVFGAANTETWTRIKNTEPALLKSRQLKPDVLTDPAVARAVFELILRAEAG